MENHPSPSIETHDAEFGGWISCLSKGDIEVWFAGGPGIGRIGYELANQDSALAAVSFELRKVNGKLTKERESELWRIIEEGQLQTEVDVERIEGTQVVEIISVVMGGEPIGHAIAIIEGDKVTFEENAFSSYEDANKFARIISGSGGRHPGP